MATSLRQHWLLFLIEGIILVILGLTAIVIPPLATLAVEILFGWLFLVSGIVGLISTFWMRPATGFLWSISRMAAFCSRRMIRISKRPWKSPGAG